MSHFSVLVITDESPIENPSILEDTLMPYHQFECTGLDNKYVQTRDITENYREDFKKHCRDPDMSYPEFCSDWIGIPVIKNTPKDQILKEIKESETNHPLKFGWIEHNTETGKVIVWDRTNPNKEWDWWTIGGRYSEKLITKLGHPSWRDLDSEPFSGVDLGANIAQIGSLDFDIMEAKVKQQREKATLDFFGSLDKSADLKIKAWMEYNTLMSAAKPGTKISFKDWILTKYSEDHLKGFWPQALDFIWFFRCTKGDPREWIEDPLPITTFAYILDGKWHTCGDMCSFGIVVDETDPKVWQAEVVKMVKSLDSSKWITVVDCHI